jgi:phosphate transport system substrate-binding protein
LALYPVYAAAVEAIYRNTGKPPEFNPNHGIAALSGTSPAAFQSLLNGESDLIFMIKPSDEQMKEAGRCGKTLSVTPIGYEAFVFFVSKTNPVDDLSVEQIRNIYSRKIARWNELGGKNEKIMPFQRPEGSGSQTMMLRVMGGVPLTRPQQEEFQISMGGIVNRVADYRNYGNSLGFSFRYYVEGLFKHEGVKILKVNGIAPTPENIQNGTYPFIGTAVIVTAGSANPNVPLLIDWFLSPQGQELVERVGYIPLQKTNGQSKIQAK